jgi:hypothetical protein
MEALHDRGGRVYCWFDEESGHFISLRGDNLAFIDGNSIYDWNGRHVGWWQDGHIRDRTGAVVLLTADAQNMGVTKPVRAVHPVKPVRHVAPVKPIKDARPDRPASRLAWSAAGMPF